MLPAPGLPKTVRGRRGLARVPAPLPVRSGRHAARVTFAEIGEVTAQACCHDGALRRRAGRRGAPRRQWTPRCRRSLCWPRCCARARARDRSAPRPTWRANPPPRASELARRAGDGAQRGRRTEPATSARARAQGRIPRDRSRTSCATRCRRCVTSVEILRRTAAGADPRCARQLDVMTRQLHQLTRLVDDLLDVSRVSRGMVELRRERVRAPGGPGGRSGSRAAAD